MDYMEQERFMCQDCGHDTREMGERYMVHEDIWETAIAAGGYAYMLCMGCLEGRLGHRLTSGHFMGVGCNYASFSFHSLRLRRALVAPDAEAQRP